MGERDLPVSFFKESSLIFKGIHSCLFFINRMYKDFSGLIFEKILFCPIYNHKTLIETTADTTTFPHYGLLGRLWALFSSKKNS